MALRVLTLNCNGIRSAASKGLFEWLPTTGADVVCLQETKAQDEQIGPALRPAGWHFQHFAAEKKGYAGTALLSRRAPDRVVRGFGVDEFDREGRWLEAQFGDLAVVSLYAPSGSAGPERQASKDRFLDAFLPFLKGVKRRRAGYIICGDWNIAHRNEDLRNWKSNQRNSGFLPHERAWLDELFGPVGFVDAFRELPQEPHQYTWWSNRGQAYAKNVGWRIDYQVLTPGLKGAVRATTIYKEQRFSDHAPLIIDYDL